MPVSSALQFFQTLNTYSHLYPNKQAEVAQQLENLINGTTVPDTIIKKEKELLRALLSQFCKLEFALPHSSSFLLFLLIFELNDKIPEHKNNTHIIIFS